MPFIIPSVLRNTFSSQNNQCRDASGMRPIPELVVLGVAEGVAPSPKPPVRIFLGTEPAHYKAERIFIWSIEHFRDPARVYEIYLMKELAGFNRRRWLTGFTNYRFAIPHFAEGSGRAIWNDVDQAYLSDPAELFDIDMGDCGLLTVPPLSSNALLDTAVMLIDCERMAPIWTGDEARNGRKNRLLAKVHEVPGLRGDLPGEWHARDEEYVPGRSKLLHWTILHTQPWHPLPQAFVYQRNPVGQVWYDMERAANRAGYHVFSADQPSAQFASLLTTVQAARTEKEANGAHDDVRPTQAAQHPKGLQDLLEKIRPTTVLQYNFADTDSTNPMPEVPLGGEEGASVTRYDLADAASDKCPAEGFDGVICRDALNYLPDEDVPWVVENLFEQARQFVYVQVEDSRAEKILRDGTCLHSRPRDSSWWKTWFDAAAERHPQVQWKLVFKGSTDPGAVAPHEIGWCGDMPRVWVLSDNRLGDTSQAVALADALGWPYEVRHLPLDIAADQPDLVIAANKRTGACARALTRASAGETRCVRIDGNGGAVADDFDIVISPEYFRLPPHPRLIETPTRLTRVNPERLAEARDHWPRLFGQAPHPRIVVILGDSAGSGPQDTRASRKMGEEIRTLAHLSGGSVFALLSRDITPGLAGALVAGLGASRHVHTWSSSHRDDDTYLAYLELADTLVVTGDDETIMADAAATGKPIHVYPLAERPSGLMGHFREAVFARSQARPLNKRGTVRPQQGLEYFCARLIERGNVLPPHDLSALQQSLLRLGITQPFGAPFVTTGHRDGLRVAHYAALEVRRLLRLGEHAAAPESDSATATDWQHFALIQP